VLLRLLEEPWLDSAEIPKLDDRVEIVFSFARSLRELGPANFLYWDGEALFAHAHTRHEPGDVAPQPGLYTLCRTCAFEPSALRAKGLSVVPASGEQRVFLVASVPLTDESWQPVGKGDLIVVSNGVCLTRVLA
jgi:glutamine amidotransferase